MACESSPVMREVQPEKVEERLAQMEGTYMNTLPSPLPHVPDAAWSRFVDRMAAAPVGAVSDSNALGAFSLTPRRLADLGLVRDLKRARKGKRNVWIGSFVEPMTDGDFLSNPLSQYDAFAASMLDYFGKLCDGEIEGDLDELTVSGALAILHRAGPTGLASWKQGKRFTDTENVYNSARGIF